MYTGSSLINVDYTRHLSPFPVRHVVNSLVQPHKASRLIWRQSL